MHFYACIEQIGSGHGVSLRQAELRLLDKVFGTAPPAQFPKTPKVFNVIAKGFNPGIGGIVSFRSLKSGREEGPKWRDSDDRPLLLVRR